jgi:hypothetical protein
MADEGGGSTGEHGRQKPALRRDNWVPDRIDASVDWMQAPVRDPAPDQRSPHAEREQLPERNHTMLALGYSGDLSITRSTFRIHMATEGGTGRSWSHGLMADRTFPYESVTVALQLL